MRFGVLGPFEVRWDGESLPLGPHRQRSLLALLLEGDVVQSLLPPGKLVGPDVGVFPLPPIEPGTAVPLTVGAVSLAASADRPEVRELVRWLLDPSYGTAWAAQELVSFAPANMHFDPAACAGDDAPHPDMAALRVELCRLAQQAVAAGAGRRRDRRGPCHVRSPGGPESRVRRRFPVLQPEGMPATASGPA